jgi:hypothetical protein
VYLDCIFKGARVVPQSLIDQETTKRPKGNADVMALKNWMMEDYHDWKTESIADVIEKYAYSLPPSDRALMLSEILSFL